jgi:zinc/manganese transport system substrate-binding protein
MKRIVLAVLTLLSVQVAQAKLNVVTTTPDLGALVQEVGGRNVNVDSIAKGTQDPHQIEPKPSYMVKVSKADLVVSNGLSLEIGWLPSLLTGARNPKVKPGAPGSLDLGASVTPIEIPHGAISRAGGDVHPDGNPHYTLDPIRMGQLALVVAKRLGELDSAHQAEFDKNAQSYKSKMESMTKTWQERIKKSGIGKIVTFHPSLNYFLDRFGVKSEAYLEPKPGIPPTVSHILEVIELIKKEKITLVLHENIYDTNYVEKLKSNAPGVNVKIVGISVGSKPELKTNADVYEQLVQAFENKP